VDTNHLFVIDLATRGNLSDGGILERIIAAASNLQPVYQSMLDCLGREKTYQIWDQSSAPHLFDGVLSRLGLFFSVYPESSLVMCLNRIFFRGNSTYDGTKLTWILKNDESGSFVSLCLSCTNASTKGADSMSLIFG
jgi:hypothetical protein